MLCLKRNYEMQVTANGALVNIKQLTSGRGVEFVDFANFLVYMLPSLPILGYPVEVIAC